MTTERFTATVLRTAPGRTRHDVWDRLWHHRPSAAKDDVLLAREARNPRWGLIVARLNRDFGAIAGLRSIELGAGRGDLSALLAQHGADVTLWDRSSVALNEARWRFDRRNLPAEYAQGDLLGDLSPWSGRYDVSLSSGVIEHFKGGERSRVIAAHREVLRAGGVAIISVPHAWCVPYRLWKFYLELRGWWPYGMERPYSRPELTRRARAVGLTQIETHCMGIWQSIGDHWIKRLRGHGPDWVARRSRLDGLMGFTLLLLGRRGAEVDGNATDPLESREC